MSLVNGTGDSRAEHETRPPRLATGRLPHAADLVADVQMQMSREADHDPQHVIGKNTVESLQSGIIFGFAGQIEGIARRMADELAPGDPDSVTIIATGGLAPLVIDEVGIIDAYEPWLTLIGLRLVYERNTSDG